MTYSETKDGRTWTSRDQSASEYELGDFMYGLVRILKPRTVLETGCYFGDTAVPIAAALNDNGIGSLTTCDTDPDATARTSGFLTTLPAVVLQEDALTVSQDKSWDLAFIDHSGDRSPVLKALKMNPGGIVVLHDSHRNYRVPEHWKRVRINTVRGLDIYACD